MRARVQSAGRRGVVLALPDGSTVKASVSGSVYRDSPGPVCGDMVDAEPGTPRWRVTGIHPRKSALARTSPLGKPQVLAANVDWVIVVSSLCSPRLRRGFLDRVLASAEHTGIPCALVLNKFDLRDSPEAESVQAVKDVYHHRAGYPVMAVSARTGHGISLLEDFVKGSTVVFTGPSGAGKTSIALRLNPGLDLPVGALNEKTSKGRHTTVAARLLNLGGDTWLMDTPGLRAFSIEHIPAPDLWLCFPEMRGVEGCRYRDCLHHTEPGCEVRELVESGKIDSRRYESYIKLLLEIREAGR